MANDAQEVAPIAMKMGCKRGPTMVTTTPPTAGEFAGPARSYESKGCSMEEKYTQNSTNAHE
jgi:hypothetical protein